jgi:hypothetical protein
VANPSFLHIRHRGRPSMGFPSSYA